VIEKMVLKIFPNEEVTGGWIKIHNEEIHNFCSSPNIIRVVISGMCCVGHETGMIELRNLYKSLGAAPEGKKLGDLYTNARIILNCSLRNWDMSMWTKFIWVSTGSIGGLL
jgi:hypothetical protein